ncbi:hypothetical protein BLOT_006607 [Blomia tropicalis]|nr:hypothetical protein BLOT_006607 [Blomia tropicalis]
MDTNITNDEKRGHIKLSSTTNKEMIVKVKVLYSKTNPPCRGVSFGPISVMISSLSSNVRMKVKIN